MVKKCEIESCNNDRWNYIKNPKEKQGTSKLFVCREHYNSRKTIIEEWENYKRGVNEKIPLDVPKLIVISSILCFIGGILFFWSAGELPQGVNLGVIPVILFGIVVIIGAISGFSTKMIFP